MRFLSFIALLLLSSPALARDYQATYDVYAGGIHALRATMDYSDKGNQYQTAVRSETFGLLAKIVRWHASFETKGWRGKTGYQPRIHQADTTSKGKREVNTYKYDKSGKFMGFTQIVDGRDETRHDLDPSIMAGTTDVLSAFLNMAKKAGEGNCSDQDMIFDSERSYRLEFRHGKAENLPSSKYSAFKGPALSCAVKVTPMGGKWHKKPRGWLKIQQQGVKNGFPPTVWLANISKDRAMPAIPVRIMVKTDYGTFIAHLTAFQEKQGK
jgi:hypothetical protein